MELYSVCIETIKENGQVKSVNVHGAVDSENAEKLFNANVKSLKKVENCDWFLGGSTFIINPETQEILFKYDSAGSETTIKAALRKPSNEQLSS